MCVRMHTYACMYVSINLSICLSIYLSFYLSINQYQHNITLMPSPVCEALHLEYATDPIP